MLDDPLGFLKRIAVGFLIIIVVLIVVGAGALAKEMLGFVGDAAQNIVDFASTF